LADDPSCRDEEPEEEFIQTRPLAGQISPLVQRQVEQEDEEEEEMIQPKRSGSHSSSLNPELQKQIRTKRGGGQMLPESERTFFEPRFGHDFSRVRIHNDRQAAEAARGLKAQAFTVGRDVFFGPGQYRPGVETGRRLLAHELTHVVQQSNKIGNTAIQRWSYGAGAPPHADYRVVPAAHKPRVDAGMRLLQRVVNNPKDYPVCHKFFRDNCPGGTMNTLANEFNAAVMWHDIDNSIWGSRVAPKNIAYTLGTYRMGRWYIPAVLVHELMHCCGQGNENTNDKAILKCGFRDVKIVAGTIVDKKGRRRF